ncbi:hypothetical protein ACLMJK_009665 [Lecanora helva]
MVVMAAKHVLVSGASVAGPALAYWLVRAGCKVTVVERAPSLRVTGQGLDIRDAARDVVKRMGIFEQMLEKSSHEEGMEFIDNKKRCYARFGVEDESGRGGGMTCDIEILRGEIAKLLFDLTKEDVSYIFNDMVESLEETKEQVKVNFANGTPTTAFDLVVAADGIGSKIRSLAFGNGSTPIKSLHSYCSYFSIPRIETDTMLAQVHHTKNGRVLATRPDNVGLTRACLILTAYDESDKRLVRLEKASKEGVSEQKALIQELFQDAGWESSRILKGMHESDDFYFQNVAQVRLDRWSSGRVAVVGDAAYACSPFAGMGTSMSFIGAYVLAGEISRQLNNIQSALENYDRVLRRYVEGIQKLPPGVPWIVFPQSMLGIKILQAFIRTAAILSRSRLATVFYTLSEYLPSFGPSFELPEYDAFKQYESAQKKIS